MTEIKQGHERTIESVERFRMRWETDRVIVESWRNQANTRLHSITFRSSRKTEGPDGTWAPWRDTLVGHGRNVLNSGAIGNQERDVALNGWTITGTVLPDYPWAQALLDEAIAIRDGGE